MSAQKNQYYKALLTSAAFFLTACGGGGGGGGDDGSSSGGGGSNSTPSIQEPISPPNITPILVTPTGDPKKPTETPLAKDSNHLSLVYLADTAADYTGKPAELLKDLSITTLENLYYLESFYEQKANKKVHTIADRKLPSGLTQTGYSSVIDPGTALGKTPGFESDTLSNLMTKGPVFVSIPHADAKQPPEFPHIPGDTKLTALLQMGGFALFEKSKSSSIGIWGQLPNLNNPFYDRRTYAHSPDTIGAINVKVYDKDLKEETKAFPSLRIGDTSTVKSRFLSLHALPQQKLDATQLKIEALTNAEFADLGINEQRGLGLSWQYFPHLVELLNKEEVVKAQTEGRIVSPKISTIAKSDGGIFAFGDRVTAGEVTLRDNTLIQTVGVEKTANKAQVQKVTLQDDRCGFILEAGRTLKVTTLDANSKTVNLKVKLSANTDTAPLEIEAISNAAAWSVSLDDYITNADGGFENKLFADGFDVKKLVPLVAHKDASLKDAKMDAGPKQFSGKSYKFSLDNGNKLLSMKIEEAEAVELFSASKFIAADVRFQGKNTDAVMAFAQEFNPSAHFGKGLTQHQLLASQHQLNLLRMGSDAQSESTGYSGTVFAKEAAYISFSAPTQNNGLSSQAALKYSLGSLQFAPYISGQYLKDDTRNADNKGSRTSVGTMLLDRATVFGATLTSSIGASVAQYSSAFTAKAPFEGRMITATAENVTYHTAEISGGVHVESKGLGVSTFLSLIGTYQPQKQKLVSMNYGEKSYDTPLSLGGTTFAFSTGALIHQSTKVGFSYASNGDASLSFNVGL